MPTHRHFSRARRRRVWKVSMYERLARAVKSVEVQGTVRSVDARIAGATRASAGQLSKSDILAQSGP